MYNGYLFHMEEGEQYVDQPHEGGQEELQFNIAHTRQSSQLTHKEVRTRFKGVQQQNDFSCPTSIIVAQPHTGDRNRRRLAITNEE